MNNQNQWQVNSIAESKHEPQRMEIFIFTLRGFMLKQGNAGDFSNYTEKGEEQSKRGEITK